MNINSASNCHLDCTSPTPHPPFKCCTPVLCSSVLRIIALLTAMNSSKLEFQILSEEEGGGRGVTFISASWDIMEENNSFEVWFIIFRRLEQVTETHNKTDDIEPHWSLEPYLCREWPYTAVFCFVHPSCQDKRNGGWISWINIWGN